MQESLPVPKRLRGLVRGIWVGGCVDGTPLGKDTLAHAHNDTRFPKNYGWLCFRSKERAFIRGKPTKVFLHESAHLLDPDGLHGCRWRAILWLLEQR